MASNNIPNGGFLTTFQGKRCTAFPKAQATQQTTEVLTTSTTSTSTSSSTSTTSTSTSISTPSAVLQTTARATSTQAAAAPPPPAALPPAQQPPVAVVPPAPLNPAIGTTTPIAQETFISTTSSISVPQVTTPSPQPPAATAQTSIAAPAPSVVSPAAPPAASISTPAVAVAPSVPISISTTPIPVPIPSPLSTSIPVAVLPTTPESELRSQQNTSTDSNLAVPTTAVGTQATETSDTAVPNTTAPIAVIPESATPGNAALITTIGTAIPGNANGVAPNAPTNAPSSPDVTPVASTDNGINTQTTVAVAGGVIGGLVAVSLLAFLIWFWRKRIVKKRRSTMLTPLGPESGFGSRMNEKMPGDSNRTSIGPTALAEKVKTTVVSSIRRLQSRFNGHSSSSSVNLSRGNSQYMDNTSHSRDSSAGLGRGVPSAKDRFFGFFGRPKDNSRGGPDQDDPFEDSRGMKENRVRIGSQPDFLTLLSMDDKQLAAQANKGRTSMNPRRSQSAGSTDHFLGNLNLNFDNPFSDANSMSHSSAKVMPLTIANPDNPFSDSNMIQQPSASKQIGPATYVHNIRRSRGQSVNESVSRPASKAVSTYRQSGDSVGSFETRRNKFRSDPFDLDRPDLLASSIGSELPRPNRTSSTGGPRRSRVPLPPGPAHTRNTSLTSKYSSGVSNGSSDQWSDPGPDVGPASTRWYTPTPTGERKGDEERRKSGVSEGSTETVGKAY